LRSRTSSVGALAEFVLAALVLAAAVVPLGATAATRAELRSAGGDRATALRVAGALLAHPLDLQLTKVRCERVGTSSFCGLTLSGVKFKHPIDTARFEREVDDLVRGALAVDPHIAEVDLWVTVPANAGVGAVVSGDFAVPTSATVYATTVPRGAAVPSGVYWDPTFARELAAGSAG
jgi:hypothetical protein